MPFLSLVHLKASICAHCGAVLAAPGARSIVVDAGGAPINFSEADPPAVMRVEITCPQEHVTEFAVPLEISDATLAGGSAESGAGLV